MKLNYSDDDLVELADWSERSERDTHNPDAKKAYSALRQGADWLIRFRIKERKQELEKTGMKQPGSGKTTN